MNTETISFVYLIFSLQEKNVNKRLISFCAIIFNPFLLIGIQIRHERGSCRRRNIAQYLSRPNYRPSRTQWRRKNYNHVHVNRYVINKIQAKNIKIDLSDILILTPQNCPYVIIVFGFLKLIFLIDKIDIFISYLKTFR